MQVSFAQAALSDVQDPLRRHLESLPGAIDSFLEDHVRESKHYVISVAGTRAGFASIHDGKLVTQFSLQPAYQRLGQVAFQGLRKLEYVSAAFVPTCDEFYLSHAIDDYRQLSKQAYFFQSPAAPDKPAEDGQGSLIPATAKDEQPIRELSGNLFGDVGRRIENGELFLTYRAGERVGFGVMARCPFQRNMASIGMYTLEPFRCTGVAVTTIQLLLAECWKRGLRAVAGCWYYNHASKRTLERAGMVTQTRLLRVEY